MNLQKYFLLSFGLLIASALSAQTLLDDTFNSASSSPITLASTTTVGAGSQSLPTSATWFVAASSTGTGTYTNGTPGTFVLGVTSTITALSYFTASGTPKTLALVGDTLTVAFNFSIPSGTPATPSNNIRLGLFNSTGGIRDTKCTGSTSSNYSSGYAAFGVFVNPNPNAGADSVVQRASGAGSTLLTTTGLWTTIGTQTSSTPGLSTTNPYQGVLSLTLATSSTMYVSFQINDLNNGGAPVAKYTVSGVSSSSIPTAFDTFAIATSGGAIASPGLSLTEVKVTYTSSQDAIPIFSPVAGSYTAAQSVTITSATSATSIAYTTDGTTPTESGGTITNGTLYSTAIAINFPTTLKAIAFNTAGGGNDSPVDLGVYSFAAAGTPTFSPVAGTYTAVQSVTISSTTSGASFAYTTDGTTPTESGGTVTHGTLYSTAVAINSTTTLKAIAFKIGNADSAVGTAAYTINLPQAATPTFSPVAGTYTDVQSVTISNTDTGDSFAYTTDGSTPTEAGGTVTHGTLYSGPVSVTANTTLEAIAFTAGDTDSTVASAAYVIDAAVPTFSPVAGTYTAPQSVTISSTTGGASIAYTTDGSTPAEAGGTVTHGTLYSGAVSVSANTTLNAIAFETGFGDSAVASAAYVIDAAVPTFSPVAGTYTAAQSVTISSTTGGASIAYTTDGSTPAEAGGTVTNGTLYSGAVSVGVNTTLNAIAFETGFGDSAEATAAYTISIPQAVAPTFSPVAGTYASAQSVTISSITGGASIAYTTDGSTPTEAGGTVTHGTLYSGAVSVSANTTLNAIAFEAGFSDSSVASAAYVIDAAVPTFSPVAGTYTAPQSVTISSTTGGASIAYTTDGSTPTEAGGTVTHGTLYSGAVSVSANTTLNAIAFETGFGDSAVATAAYVIDAAVPTFSPVAGTYTAPQSVTISSTTGGASIAYTTDGSTPTEVAGTVTHGTLYAGAVSVSANTTLNAIAFETGFGDSAVASAAYVIAAAVPTFSPVAGTYTAPQSVTISSTTGGALIAYTTDGSTPTEVAGTVTNGTLYSGPVSVGANTTLNAIAFETGFADSAEASAAYVIAAAVPTFSPVAGTYTAAQSVTISSTTGGASIAYTTDGTTPTEVGGTVTNGTLYSGPVSIGATATLSAIAFGTGNADSAVATSVYNINIPGVASTPTFSPVAGTYASAQSVTISSTTGGASIAYTTDGSTPTEAGGTVTNGILYSGAVSVSTNTTLKAIAFAIGDTDSAVASAAYVIAAAVPTFSPVAGTYTATQSVTISSTTGGASIAYTTDGSTPTEAAGTVTHGTLYSTAVSVSANTTLKAIAFKIGNGDSAVASAAYVIAAAVPTFSPVAGTYTTTQSVTISSTTGGASIAYTTDGSTPTEAAGTVTHGTLYSTAVSVSANTTLNAIAFKIGNADSAMATAAYVIAAAVPTFSPVAGTYTAAQSVTISSTTGGASIAYTTDGSTPTETGGTVTHGTLYSGAISVGVTTTLNAIAFKIGNADSAEATAAYTINIPQAATPTFSPVAGTYTAVQSVTISTATSGASIAYTTDGTTPTEAGGTVTHGTLYSTAVAVNATATLNAIAFKAGFTDSTVGTAAYTINIPQAATPTFSPVAGTYTAVQSVTISTATSGASIAYTTDGSAPTETGGTITNGTLYSTAVAVNATATLKAIAFKAGFTDSAVGTAAYTINIPQAATPTFSPVAGTYTAAQSVTISTITSGASIAYTTDGSTPTEAAGTVTHGTLYSGAVSIGATTTLNAIAFKIGDTDSAVGTAAYTINIPQAATPTFSPVAGTYTATQSVTISTVTSGASVAYTTDGSTPTETAGTVTHGTLYSTAVSVSANTTLKAIAFKIGDTDSAVASAAYVIAAAVPTFSPVAGTYTAVQSVTISSATGGASVAYTTDGSTPTEAAGTVTHGTLYSTAVSVSATTTLNAIAFKTGNADSAEATAAYTINLPQVATPTFSPVAGTYTAVQSVTISSTTGGASFAYTTDGTVPTESGAVVTHGTLYSGAVSIGTTSTLKAIGFASGMTDSAVATGLYTINIPPPQVVAPVFSPVAGTYTAAQAVTISSSTSGALIAYTTDASTPTEAAGTITHGILYSGAVSISATTTLSAIGFKVGDTDSTVTSGVYTINLPQAATPTFSPVAGTYTAAQSVTISNTDTGDSFAFTTDGSTPTETGGTVTHGTLYSTPVAIGATATLKAIAFKTAMTDSAVASGSYTITLPSTTPPASGGGGGGAFDGWFLGVLAMLGALRWRRTRR